MSYCLTNERLREMRRFLRNWLTEAYTTFAELGPSEKFAKAWLWMLVASLIVISFVTFGFLLYLSVIATPYCWGIWFLWFVGPITIWARDKQMPK